MVAAIAEQLARQRRVLRAAKRWRVAVLNAGLTGTIEGWRAAQLHESELAEAVDELLDVDPLVEDDEPES